MISADIASVPVAVAAVLGRLHEPLNLGHGKIKPAGLLLVAYAVVVILLAAYPWNILLLASSVQFQAASTG